MLWFAERMAAFFLCYRRKDAPDVTGRIHDRVVARFGPTSVFRDVDSLPLGVDFRDHLNDALDRCAALLAVIGPRWEVARSDAGSPDYVHMEIEGGIRRGLPVFPILVLGAQMPKPESLPESIGSFAFLSAALVRSDPDFHSDVDKLLRALASTLENGDSSSDGVSLVLVSGPFKGRRYPLVKDRILIGRRPRCDVILSTPLVSSYHAEILTDGHGGHSCQDLRSTNGTHINGVRIPYGDSSVIADGDVVAFGEVEVRFRKINP